MFGDYEQTLKFLGIDENSHDDNWQKALFTNKYMLNDPYIIDCVHRLIKKKIDNAKIGKLRIKAIINKLVEICLHLCNQFVD